MAATAQSLIDDVKRKQEQVARKKSAHPDEISHLKIAAHLALAQSNIELATAIKALKESAGKNNGTLQNAITSLTTKIADLAKK
ncbi:hypothetical protein [Streptomyces cellulosae]|uniref:hypothetical protein n=1 Tax=Streptomyces cellulosae TaxID=1968 RepID=UPI0004C661D6|nr:hypothetical protein [Streptomyces cellulosae]